MWMISGMKMDGWWSLVGVGRMSVTHSTHSEAPGRSSLELGGLCEPLNDVSIIKITRVKPF